METMETRLKFLDNAPESLVSGGETFKLSSHLRYIQSLFLQQGDWNVPKKKDPLPSTCSHCFVDFRRTQYTLTVKPSEKPGRNVMRILKKKASSETLTGAENALLTHYLNTRGKKLIMRCGICQKETEGVLKKLKEERRAKPNVSTNSFKDNKKFQTVKANNNSAPSKTVTNAPPHFKKKKKKDQFAGLKKTVVMSVKSKKKLQ